MNRPYLDANTARADREAEWFTRMGPRIVLAFALLVLGVYFTLDHMSPAGRRLIKIRGEDPVAYFGTAHSILFDRDFNLTNEFAHMPPDGRLWTLDQPSTGLPGSPWGLGYSILEIPLLAFGTGVDALAGNPADGYSRWAVFFYCIGTVLMAGLGLMVLFPLLRLVAGEWHITPENHQSAYALFLTLVVFFGTNVGYYAFSQMSHSATFLFSGLFLLTWWRVRDSEKAPDWLLLGLIGGFLSITRWQDALQFAGPLIYDLMGGGILRKQPAWWRSRALYALGIFVLWIPQMLQWRAIYGKYLTIPQGAGIFSFPPQHALQLLFSTQSGWFTWTPVVMLGVAGLVIGVFRNPRLYVPWTVVLALQIALIGSVSFWDGLGSFSSRYLLSNTPIVAVGMMTVYGCSGVWVRRAASLACLFGCVITSLFALQFRLDLVPLSTPLTFSELVTDKLRLGEVWRRKAAVRQARELLDSGNAESAMLLLEGTLPLGEDRDVDRFLEIAYRTAGRNEQAASAALRSRRFLDSMLF